MHRSWQCGHFGILFFWRNMFFSNPGCLFCVLLLEFVVCNKQCGHLLMCARVPFQACTCDQTCSSLNRVAPPYYFVPICFAFSHITCSGTIEIHYLA